MSSGVSRAYRRKLLDHLFKTTPLTVPTHIYVALYTTAPNSQGSGGTETTYTNYLRVACDAWDAATDADPAVVANTAAVTFSAAGSSATIVAFGLYDADSGGNFLGYGACSASVSSGVTPQFDAGDLQISMDETT
jgi:hypothetical protein